MLNKAQDGIVAATTAVQNLCNNIAQGIVVKLADRLRELEPATTGAGTLVTSGADLLKAVKESVAGLLDEYKVYSNGVKIAGWVTVRRSGLGESKVDTDLQITPLGEDA